MRAAWRPSDKAKFSPPACRANCGTAVRKDWGSILKRYVRSAVGSAAHAPDIRSETKNRNILPVSNFCFIRCLTRADVVLHSTCTRAAHRSACEWPVLLHRFSSESLYIFRQRSSGAKNGAGMHGSSPRIHQTSETPGAVTRVNTSAAHVGPRKEDLHVIAERPERPTARRERRVVSGDVQTP